jgi:hypothetical protein
MPDTTIIENENEIKTVYFHDELKNVDELKEVINIFSSFVDKQIIDLCNEIKSVLGE